MWSENMEKLDLKKASKITDERLLDPKAFGGVDSAGRVKESKQDMFDSNGTINAYDNDDVVTQQQHFASLRDKYQRKAKTGSFYTPDQRAQIIESAFAGDDAERIRFGSEMIPLILDRLDYEGFIRQVYRTHEVPQGQIISYEKDVNVAALVIQEDGQTIDTQVKGNRVFVPEFAVTAAPRISIAEIAQRQFDIVDRAHDKATFQIMLKEDRNGLRQLYQAATIENSSTSITTNLTKTVFENIQYEVERHRLLVDKFIMNRKELGDIKKDMNVIDYDPQTSRDVLMTGIFGSIWGVNIFISAGVDEAGIENVAVPEGVVFAVTEGRYLGAMPIRVGLTVLPADQFVNNQASYGWLFYEQIGQTVLNSRAVAMGVKSGASIPSWMSS